MKWNEEETGARIFLNDKEGHSMMMMICHCHSSNEISKLEKENPEKFRVQNYIVGYSVFGWYSFKT